MSARPNRDERCDEVVGEPPGYWHFHRCTRPARFRAERDGATFNLCGTHKNQWQRLGWLSATPLAVEEEK